jgi:hypothetical protein
MKIEQKFEMLGVDHAPGQEIRRRDEELPVKGDPLPGVPVDFSHGDVDAHPPIPERCRPFVHVFTRAESKLIPNIGEKASIRKSLAEKLSVLTAAPLIRRRTILTPVTQGALFLAMGPAVARATRCHRGTGLLCQPENGRVFEGEKMPVYRPGTKKEQEAV